MASGHQQPVDCSRRARLANGLDRGGRSAELGECGASGCERYTRGLGGIARQQRADVVGERRQCDRQPRRRCGAPQAERQHVQMLRHVLEAFGPEDVELRVVERVVRRPDYLQVAHRGAADDAVVPGIDRAAGGRLDLDRRVDAEVLENRRLLRHDVRRRDERRFLRRPAEQIDVEYERGAAQYLRVA